VLLWRLSWLLLAGTQAHTDPESAVCRIAGAAGLDLVGTRFRVRVDPTDILGRWVRCQFVSVVSRFECRGALQPAVVALAGLRYAKSPTCVILLPITPVSWLPKVTLLLSA
jgi:hypothetical protein